jgi:hypothetical protein
LREKKLRSRQALHVIEVGNTRPWPKTIKRFSKYYGVPGDYFTRERTPEEIAAIRATNATHIRTIRKGE